MEYGEGRAEDVGCRTKDGELREDDEKGGRRTGNWGTEKAGGKTGKRVGRTEGGGQKTEEEH